VTIHILYLRNNQVKVPRFLESGLVLRQNGQLAGAILAVLYWTSPVHLSSLLFSLAVSSSRFVLTHHLIQISFSG